MIGASSDIVFLFAGSGLVLYVASRAAADALTQTSDPRPGRMALGQWMPIAWTALLATAAGHSEVGIGLAFATSVAALALDLGVLTIICPPVDAPPPTSRAWPFVLPAAILPLLAGLSSTFNLIHAVMMAVLGVAVAGVWNVPTARPADQSSTMDAPPRPIRVAQLALAIALGAVGGWIAFQAIMAADAKTRVASSGLLAAAIVAPLLSLPMLGTGAIAGNKGRMAAVTSNLVAVVLLNLCALLPAVIFVDYARDAILLWHSGTHELRPLIGQLKPVAFPLGVWRVDCVLVMVLGVLLVPMSLGRWNLRRGEGVALAFGYIAYLIVSAAVTVRL